MNRNEVFRPDEITGMDIRLAWATLEISADDAGEIQVIISGTDAEVEDMQVEAADGRLRIEQPSYGLTPRIDLVRWMQVYVRIPRAWRGQLDASTISGPLRVTGAEGSDLSLSTVSGGLRASGLKAIDMKLHTVTGFILCQDLECEKLGMRTISGTAQLDGVAGARAKVGSVSGDCQITFVRPVKSLDGAFVSGDVCVRLPRMEARLNMRGMASRISVENIAEKEEAEAQISITMVSGHAAVIGTAEEGGD